MARNYTNIAIKDFGGGIDQVSSPDSIPRGFCEDLQNVVTSGAGFLAKRQGYQGYYGWIPVRVSSVTHSGTSITFSFDSSIDVSRIDSSPIVVYGKLSASQSGDWSNSNNQEYYTSFSTGLKTTLAVGGSPVTVTEATHGVASGDVHVELLSNTNTSTTDWQLFYANRVDIADSSTFDVDIEYSGLPSALTVFTAIDDTTTVSGTDYTPSDFNLTNDQTFTTTDVSTTNDTITITSHGLSNGDPVQFTSTGTLPTGLSAGTTYYVVSSAANTFKVSATSGGSAIDITGTGSGTHTVSAGDIVIASATHGLATNSIIIQCWAKDTGSSEYFRIFPDSYSVNISSGDVTISITNSDTSFLTVKVAMSEADSANFTTALIGTGSANGNTHTVDITTTSDFYEVAIYESSGGILTYVIPDDVSYTQSSSTLSVTITNSGSAATYYIIYKQITVSSSSITVTDNGAVSASYTDSSPQLTVWGLKPSELYTTTTNQEGHVTHIDSYSTDTEARVISGLGGNLFSARTRAEESDTYLIPTTNISISGSVASNVNIYPCFDVTGSSASRTRGLILADDVSSQTALVTAVSFVSSGVAKYTLSLTNKSGDLSTAIDTATATADKLTVTGMAHDIHNGTFTITAVDNDNDTITVSNPSLKIDDFDETGARGRAGIFTDQVTLSSNSIFLPSDTFTTNLVSSEPTVDKSSGTTVVLSGVTSQISLPAGLTVYGSRTASVVPVDATTNFVRGDMCTIGSITREVRVLHVNTSSDLTISSITGDGTTATVTTSSSHGLVSGQKVLILRSGVAAYDGEQTITGVGTATTFQFASSETSTASAGVVLGTTIEIDESLTISEDTTATALSVTGRWIPIEAPTTSDDLPKTTYFAHLDNDAYNQQSTIRSTMVGNNVYLTNYNDEVLKFDGTSIYQAGLFRWQPQLFVQLDTTTGSITLNGTTGNEAAAASGNKFTVAEGEEVQFAPGDVIRHDEDDAIYTVKAIGSDPSNAFGFVYVTETSISGTAGTGDIKLADRFKYYFRLNAIDANKNIIASAATGADDFVVDVTAAGQIKMRLIGFPVWGNYDYDKLELEVYRTKAGTASPFYRVSVKDLSFSAGDGYIDFTDSTADSLLGTKDLDSVNTNLKGAEIGTAWTQPLRAKYVTSADNRLILGNIKDYPELDIVLKSTEGVGDITAANMAGKKFLFRKDSTSTDTTTDMVNEVTYEFVNSGAVTIVPQTDIANDATTFTVTNTGHGLSAGDWVYMYHSSNSTVNTLTYAGWWQINSATANTFTVKSNVNTAAATTDVDRYVTATTTTDIPVWLGTDGNMNQVGANTINEFTAMIRLANAINASMRMADTSLSSPDQSTFVPWLTANAGSEYLAGQIVIRQPGVFSTTAEVVLPAAITGSAFFVNGFAKAAAAEVSTASRTFPSRVLVSYRNFPEIFDNPYSDALSSDSVVDVNEADGQAITGIIPFFGEAVFGSGQVEEIIVVFKENSIYLLNIKTRELSKIESRGLGCTAPFSIASTKNGIMFANNSGIYRLNRDQTISYVGRAIERLFRDNVDRDQLSIMYGHHYAIEGQYKLSVPVVASGATSQTTNNQVMVYDHKRESEGSAGAWTRFTNHSATGWTNLSNDAFFATTDGQVFKVRRAGDSTDYRDDASAVAEMQILLRAEDFDNPGSRKVVNSVVSHFHVRRSSVTGTSLSLSTDLDGSFTNLGNFTLTKSSGNKAKTVRSSLSTRKANQFQLKYLNSTKDEDVVLSGVDYSVALLSDRGTMEQDETS